MIILRSAIIRPMNRVLRGLLIIAVVIFLSWIASSWINYEAMRTPEPDTTAFLHWWLDKALDCSPDAARQHEEAASRMSPTAAKSFNGMFWQNSKVRNSTFEISAFSLPKLRDKIVLQSAVVKWKCATDTTAYLQVNIDVKISKEADGYRIADWSMERGLLVQTHPLKRWTQNHLNTNTH